MMNTRYLLAFVVLVLISSCDTGSFRGEIIETGVPEWTFKTWQHYLGDPGRSHYSVLDQINRSNVQKLELAWQYESGGLQNGRNTQMQTNPLIVGDVLFGVNPSGELFALKADQGTRIWTFNPPNPDGSGLGVNRGLMYANRGDKEHLYFSSGSFLYAVNPADGQLITGFGNVGRIDLREGLGREPETLSVVANTPGGIYEDLLIMGTRVMESPGAAPGHIRAYDLSSGELVWTFKTIPDPGEFGYDTWPEKAYEYIGGANNWSGMALDHELGMVYLPTGSAAFDFYGGNRIGENLFANCLIALDARTGERKWHFQFVHHDLWDRDLPAPPNLVTVRHGGKAIAAVAQVTKSGHVFLFDRLTGTPLFPIREVDFPPSVLEGEEAWPTQPIPEKPAPFARQELTESLLYAPDSTAFVADFVDRNANDKPQTVREHFRQLGSKGQFLPPDEQGVVVFPGFDGGAEWGGAAVDPGQGIMYVNSSEMAWILKMKKIGGGNAILSPGQSLYALHCARCHGGDRQGLGAIPALRDLSPRLSADSVRKVVSRGRGAMPPNPQLKSEEVEAIVEFITDQETGDHRAMSTPEVPYSLASFGRLLDSRGYPIVKPPWGTLNALDLNTGEYLWQVPLGNIEELNDPEYPVSGTENYGGPVVTAGGLVFIAATKDEKIRAFDKETGEQLWEHQLPAGGYATPATYEVNGKQYLVISCGGGKMGTKSGDRYVAFALPD